MSEIEYTVNDDAIEVEITREMRGLDVTVPSGDVGVVTAPGVDLDSDLVMGGRTSAFHSSSNHVG